MASIFDSVEVEPSAFEIALQSIFLSGLQQRVQETGDLSAAVNATLGFKRDASGNLVELTDDERFEALSPQQQNLFNRLEDQNTRLERAFAGDLPVSERLKQRSEDQFRLLQEGRARLGGDVQGTNLTDAQGRSTPDIQSIGEAQRTQGLLESEEAFQERQTGFNNLFGGTGILQTSQNQDFTNRVNAPARFDIGGFGGGLLAQTGAASRVDAQFDDDRLTDIGGLLTDIVGLFT